MAKQNNEKNNKHFWKDFKAELKKVIWPTKKQLTNNTVIVIGMVIATAIIVLVLDLAFEAGNNYGINKMKESVKSAISEKKDENESSEEEDSKEKNEEITENEEANETEDSEESENTTSESSAE